MASQEINQPTQPDDSPRLPRPLIRCSELLDTIADLPPYIKRIMFYGGSMAVITLGAAVLTPDVNATDLRTLITQAQDDSRGNLGAKAIRNTIIQGITQEAPALLSHATISLSENAAPIRNYRRSVYNAYFFLSATDTDHPILTETTTSKAIPPIRSGEITVEGLRLAGGEETTYAYSMNVQLDPTEQCSLTIDYFREYGLVHTIQLNSPKDNRQMLYLQWLPDETGIPHATAYTILDNTGVYNQIFVSVYAKSPFDISLDYETIDWQRVTNRPFVEKILNEWITFLSDVENTDPAIIQTFAQKMNTLISPYLR